MFLNMNNVIYGKTKRGFANYILSEELISPKCHKVEITDQKLLQFLSKNYLVMKDQIEKGNK